ncbi:MAG: FAD:protein FMN transferase [Burkholderiaceae bacterium]|nr:FAD:protein FMN transferase [Burkholderiaceae bacterium]
MKPRRRFLAIAASAGAIASLPSLARASTSTAATSTWKGIALGASASMTLVHPDRELARAAIDDCVAEIDRLESIFSLYRPQSALVRLNRAGMLAQPPQELVELLSFALALARRSDGAFDPTVQPLYRLLADHFARPGAAPDGPAPDEIARALESIGHRHVELEADIVRLHRPGMAITLNGVAQGFITDRIGGRLRLAGFDNVLVDIGEALALGRRADGHPWRAAVADPRRGDRTLFELDIGNAPGAWPALASSAGSGTRFGPSTRRHHLLDPRTGASASHHAGVTVAAPRATLADGLSTMLSVLSPARARAMLPAWPEARAWFIAADGRVEHVAAPA